MIRFGLQIPWFGYQDVSQADALRTIAEAAETAGFDSLWLADHLWQSPVFGSPDLEMLECYTSLGFLSAITQRLQLGAMVSGVALRHPAVLIKQVTTLDVLSGGRAWLGLGLGWFRGEAEANGMPFPSREERVERLEEILEIAKRTWMGSTGPYSGKHYTLDELTCSPAPIRQPYPPILVGGSSAAALLLAARYADAWNGHGTPSRMKELSEVLTRACEAVGRDPDAVERTWLGHPIAGSDLLDEALGLARAGVRMIAYNVPPSRRLQDALDLIGHLRLNVMPHLAPSPVGP